VSTHCLHIGINDYRGISHDLAGCVPDARNWARLFNKDLRRRGTRRDAVDMCPYFGHADSQMILLDRRATRDAVLGELDKLLRLVGEDDWAVITFSGHGTYVTDKSGDETDGYDEALVCHGLDTILDDRLGWAIEHRPQQESNVLVITDSCHSGTANRTLGPRLLPPFESEARVRFLPPNRIPKQNHGAGSRERGASRQKRQRKLYNAIHLAACGDEQFAADASFAGGPEGAFSHFALESVCSLGGRPSFGDWCAAIAKNLPNREYEQCPQWNGYSRCLDWKIPTM